MNTFWLFASLVTIAAAGSAYAVTLAMKHHLDPRLRHEIAFVLALTTVAVCYGTAFLVALFGER